MSQDQWGPDQVPIAALPPVFTHIDIAEHSQETEPNQIIAELKTMIRAYLQAVSGSESEM